MGGFKQRPGKGSSKVIPIVDINQIPIDELHDLILQLEKAGFVIPVKIFRLGRPAKHDYTQWDWSKRNIVLAREHSVTVQTVANWRRRLARPLVRKYRYMEWDWSKPDAEIARANRVPIGSVQKYRHKLGKPFPPRSSRVPLPDPSRLTPRYNVDWEHIDWHRADITIAREVGCTREYVRQKRARHGVEKFSWSMEKYEDFLKVAGDRKEMSYSDLNGLHLSKITFARYCTQAGIKRLAVIRQQDHLFWPFVNWNLPNKDLNIIWKLCKNGAANRRCNFHMPKPAFRHKVGVPMPEEYHRQLAEEIRKAEEFFQV